MYRSKKKRTLRVIPQPLPPRPEPEWNMLDGLGLSRNILKNSMGRKNTNHIIKQFKQDEDTFIDEEPDETTCTKAGTPTHATQDSYDYRAEEEDFFEEPEDV